MRFLHTSDWHAGRIWKGLNRLDELEEVLGHLAEYTVEHGIEVLLLTGDVFDTGVPSAAAERVVFGFLKRIGLAGVQTVLIAGNHDSAARIDAWGQLAELVGVHALGKVRGPDAGGVLELKNAAGEVAVVAALPFASPRYLVSALDLAEGDTEASSRYADRLRRAVALLCSRFRPDAVNILCAHTHLDGAIVARSERRVHIGDDWAASPEALPPDAHYVALGHIHKPQKMSAPSPAYYAGSPLQLDFGEEGEAKSFVVVDAKPGFPATIERVPYRGGRTLHTVEATLEQLELRQAELAQAGWLRVVLPLDTPDPDANRKVRALLNNVVSVDVRLPEVEDEIGDEVVRLAENSPPDVFKAWYEQAEGQPPEPALVSLFSELYAAAGGR